MICPYLYSGRYQYPHYRRTTISLINKKTGKRDFVAERLAEKPARKIARNNRNKARRKMGLKNGDPREVDHKKELSKGGSNDKRNLKIVSRKENANKEVLRKKRKAKK